MPKINVYLPDDLADAVKDAGVPVSAVCQRALEQAVRRVTILREVATGGFDDDGTPGAPELPFTRRAMTMLENAQAAAASAGTRVRTEHVLAALMDADSMAVRLLQPLDITPRQVEGALQRRVQHEPAPAAPADAEVSAAADQPRLSPEVAKVIELAGNESSGLGNSYVGSEHLMLGLIAEPDGIAGSVLRSLGADLRVTRRMVAAALAGWFAASDRARAATAASGEGSGTAAPPLGPAASGQLADQLSAMIKSELAPVLARVERLEQAAG